MNPLSVALNSINYKKDDVAKEIKDFYPPFVVNRTLSYHIDSVIASNLANTMNDGVLPDMAQYYLLKGLVSPRKRFAKWMKPIKSDDAKLVMEIYNVSEPKAHEYLKLLSDDELSELKKIKGGV